MSRFDEEEDGASNDGILFIALLCLFLVYFVLLMLASPQ